jgi:hypothetical protein
VARLAGRGAGRATHGDGGGQPPTRRRTVPGHRRGSGSWTPSDVGPGRSPRDLRRGLDEQPPGGHHHPAGHRRIHRRSHRRGHRGGRRTRRSNGAAEDAHGPWPRSWPPGPVAMTRRPSTAPTGRTGPVNGATPPSRPPALARPNRAAPPHQPRQATPANRAAPPHQPRRATPADRARPLQPTEPGPAPTPSAASPGRPIQRDPDDRGASVETRFAGSSFAVSLTAAPLNPYRPRCSATSVGVS